MHHARNRLDHCNRCVGLENIAPHVDTRGTLVNGFISHLKRLAFRKLFATRDHNGHRATGDNPFKSLFHEIAFYVLRADFRRYAR